MDAKNESTSNIDPKKGKSVYISHISLNAPLLSVIQKIEGHHIFLLFSKPINNIVIGDPIICKYLESDIEYIFTCDTTDVFDQNFIRALITGIEKHTNNRRYPRYAVSMNGVIVSGDSLEFNCCTVKSLSLSGVAINCKVFYELQKTVSLSIISSPEDVVNVSGRIVRNNKIIDYFEYGIEFTSIDSLNKQKLDTLIMKLEEEAVLLRNSTLG